MDQDQLEKLNEMLSWMKNEKELSDDPKYKQALSTNIHFYEEILAGNATMGEKFEPATDASEL